MSVRPKKVVLLRDATIRHMPGRHMMVYSNDGWDADGQQKSSVREHRISVSGKSVVRFLLGDKPCLTQLGKIDERMMKHM